MFDIGFWELLVVAVVALLVVGPERLPALAHDAGKWIGKIRRFISQTRREIETEFRLAETKSLDNKLSDLDELMRNAPDQDPDFVKQPPTANTQDVPGKNAS